MDCSINECQAEASSWITDHVKTYVTFKRTMIISLLVHNHQSLGAIHWIDNYSTLS